MRTTLRSQCAQALPPKCFHMSSLYRHLLDTPGPDEHKPAYCESSPVRRMCAPMKLMCQRTAAMESCGAYGVRTSLDSCSKLYNSYKQ